MDQQSFFRAVFGGQHQLHSHYLYGLQLYCLFVITLMISLCLYAIHQSQALCDKTFEERVHGLRVKYATTGRTGYD